MNPLLGTWKLVAATAIRADGTVEPDIYGSCPVGFITYTADGCMMVMFAKGDRPFLSGNPTSPFALDTVPCEELAQAFSSFNAYAGTYTLEGNTVSHHLTIASIPNRVGTTLVRTVTFSGDRIALRTPETVIGGASMVFELVWERVEAAGKE